MKQLNTKNVKPFVTAGKAIFTLKSLLTGNHFTYKVNKHKDKDLYFVQVLTGGDNTSDYSYMGTIFGTKFTLTKNSKIGEDALSYSVFKWMWKYVENLPDTAEFYHMGRCARCGRTLTVPESIETGFGPVCAKLQG